MRTRVLVVATVLAGFAAARADAETLDNAMAESYNNNPQLQAERANLRATDENVPQALSGWRPVVTFTGSVGQQKIDTNEYQSQSSIFQTPNVYHFTQNQQQSDLRVTQNVYSGGKTVAQTAEAENLVRAERANYLATEGQVLFSVAQAYLDVLRDQAVVDLNISNEQVLRRQLEATEDEFRVGSVTRTDVAQSEARLAAATATRQAAEGNLETSRAEYSRAVGHAPEKLEDPKLRPVLPASRDEALALAATKNPNVIKALFTEDSARDVVVATRAQLLPSLNIVGDFIKSLGSPLNYDRSTTESVVAQVTVPLYEGGNVYSQTRQAVETVGYRKGLTDDTRRQALQGATQFWETIQASRASIISLQSQIRADEIALDGTRQEQQVGSRTVLDVLNAEQELFNGKVNLVTAQHDLAVAEYNLAFQIGRLSAADLALPVKLYDANEHYKSVRDKWIGFDSKDGATGTANNKADAKE